MSENKLLIIRFIINTIKDIQETLELSNLKPMQYTDTSRGMVRGLCISTQRVAEQFDSQPKNKLSGFCAWGTILLMRDFKPKDIDVSIAKALKNFEMTLYVEEGILEQEESGTEVAEARGLPSE